MNKFSDYFEAQKKSKIKAGDGLAFGKYKFFNSSNMQTKFYNQALYHSEALIFGTGGNASIHYCFFIIRHDAAATKDGAQN